jgi:hypothetical protein
MYKITEEQLKELLKIAFIRGCNQIDWDGAQEAAEDLFKKYLAADDTNTEAEQE